ncbi:hypothetical protein LOD99_5837 [Oopsacas minuta]|uniref:Uncharacterized protein n=1 Tax=Oopsacas minuta TaxID=111878 RepID=A0AAV7JNA9_9METZ|nr:hypothetical protein LOD99_5837 [Oopsacas minuta]
MAFTLIIIIPSAVILVITTNKQLYATNEWNSSTILTADSLQLIPFNPLYCPKDKNFYSQPFLNYLEAKAPDYSALTLDLKTENVATSHTIVSCYANANEICSIPIQNYENIFAFVALETIDVDKDSIVEWACSYFNLPFLLSVIILSCCSCCCLICYCSACLCCMTYCCCGKEPNPSPPPHRRWQSRQRSERQVANTVSNRDTQPLLVNIRTERAMVDGVMYQKETSTLRRVAPNGMDEVYEHVKLIATDGTNAVVSEATHALILN